MSETIEIVPYIAEWAASSKRNAHVVESGGDEERRTLAFRDYIRDHDVVAREREAFERSLAPQFSASTIDSRQAYANPKLV